LPVTRRRIAAQPLTAAAFAPYGSVVEAPPEASGRSANQGTARRFDRLAPLVNARGARAEANVCVFRCSPWPAGPLVLRLLEKHPSSTQLFAPMNARRWLVVVAGGDEAPDLETAAAFVAAGKQAVAYAAGVWHHPLIALEAVTDFACVVFEDGTTGDAVEMSLPDGALTIDV
jgi:ureidoglycolate lyase